MSDEPLFPLVICPVCRRRVVLTPAGFAIHRRVGTAAEIRAEHERTGLWHEGPECPASAHRPGEVLHG